MGGEFVPLGELKATTGRSPQEMRMACLWNEIPLYMRGGAKFYRVQRRDVPRLVAALEELGRREARLRFLIRSTGKEVRSTGQEVVPAGAA